MTVRRHLVQEHHLVGEDVGRIVVVVVEVAQLRVEKARRAGRRDHPGRADLRDVLPAAVHPALPLLGPERFLGPGRHVVDHRVPDRPRVLQHVHVDLAEIGVQHVQVDGPGIVHVEGDGLPVVDDQAGIADGPVGGRAQRDDHHVQVALGPAHPVFDRVGGLEEPVEAQLLQLAPQVGHREVRKQHDGVLVDVFGQVLRVEVVLVQVRDVQIVDLAERRPVERAVVGKREPGREVRRVHPGIAQDVSGLGVDAEAGVADARDLHRYPLWWLLARRPA